MDRDFSPLKAVLGLLAVGVIALLGFLIFQGVKPTIKNAQPLNGSKTPKGNVAISAEVRGEANLREVRLRIDNKPITEGDPNRTIKANSERFWEIRYNAPLPKGPHDVEVIAVDVRGREQVYRWRFTAAGPSNPPKFATPLPRNGARLQQGDGLISLQAFSDVGTLESFKLTLNGRTLGPFEIKGGPGERTTAQVRRTFEAGEYTVEAEAIDTEGERNTFQWKFSVVAPGKGESDTLFFAPTSTYVFAPFANYWLKNGGLAIYGLPITPEFEQNGLAIQWFERARFELNPKTQQVQLGLLGNELRQPDPPLPIPPADADRRFFPETGHTLGGAFRQYWEAHGGLAQFGLPLTEEITENGRRVQWFERARFELNGPNEVVLGQLGRTLWERGGR